MGTIPILVDLLFVVLFHLLHISPQLHIFLVELLILIHISLQLFHLFDRINILILLRCFFIFLLILKLDKNKGFTRFQPLMFPFLLLIVWVYVYF